MSEKAMYPRGGGKPISKADLSFRLNLVEKWMTAGRSHRFIVDEMSNRYAVGYSTVRRYIATIRERWVDDRKESRKTDVEERLARMRYMARKTERKEAWSASARYDDMINDVLGVYMPEKHEVSVQAAVVHAVVDLSKLDDEQLEQLYGIASKALPAASVPSLPPSGSDDPG